MDAQPAGCAMRIIVCGGRDYRHEHVVNAILTRIKEKYPDLMIIQGGAIGADMLAKLWALDNKVGVATVFADWATHGKKAGPLRNQRMIDDWKPYAVVAFPGRRGTADMVRRARKAGIQVWEV